MNGEVFVDLVEFSYVVSKTPWAEALRSAYLADRIRAIAGAFEHIADMRRELGRFAFNDSIPEINGVLVAEPKLILPTGIYIFPGSISARCKIGALIVWGVVDSAVQSVSTYPDFKEGIRLMQEDAMVLGDFLTRRLSAEAEEVHDHFSEVSTFPPEEVERQALDAIRQQHSQK